MSITTPANLIGKRADFLLETPEFIAFEKAKDSLQKISNQRSIVDGQIDQAYYMIKSEMQSVYFIENKLNELLNFKKQSIETYSQLNIAKDNLEKAKDFLLDSYNINEKSLFLVKEYGVSVNQIGIFDDFSFRRGNSAKYLGFRLRLVTKNGEAGKMFIGSYGRTSDWTQYIPADKIYFM